MPWWSTSENIDPGKNFKKIKHDVWKNLQGSVINHALLLLKHYLLHWLLSEHQASSFRFGISKHNRFRSFQSFFSFLIWFLLRLSLLLGTSVHPCIIFALLVSMALVSTIVRIVQAGSSAFVQIDQKVTALVAISQWDFGCRHGRQILFGGGFRLWIVSSSHCNIDDDKTVEK